ncbi:MAG: hypothetical protein ABJD07_02395 [Gemmatimonadaceae bacterium]
MRELQVTVSRKTPLDGKLEIPAEAATLLLAARSFHVTLENSTALARVSLLACSCAKANRSGEHQHHFLESELLRRLEPGSVATLTIESDGAVRVSPGRAR